MSARVSEEPCDPGEALLRALVAGAPAASAMELVAMTSTAWASATFDGARHAIALVAQDVAGLSAWLADLPEAVFRLPGHLVADLAVESVVRRDGVAAIGLAALTVVEA